MPAGDVAWKEYYQTEIMNLIYEYLGINFEDSDEYIEVTDSDDYARLGQEKIDAAEQTVKLEKGKEIAKLEYDA